MVESYKFGRSKKKGKYVSYHYVHTTSNVIKRDKNKQILRPYVKKYLYSIINGFSNLNFGYNSLYNVSKNVKDFYDNLYEDESLMIDSGGYSLIVGDINPRDTNKFIDCYNYFLEYHNDLFHYIMSLDIPIFLKYPSFNTKKIIKDFNYRSLFQSKEILNKNNDLYDKFMFVWQFKMPKQFEIWKELYNEFFSDNTIKNHAIGGLVGLKSTANLKFSPFIGPVFRNLKLIENNKYDESIIHLLGVHSKADRFTMIFLDKLFNDTYNFNKKIKITFDTIHYTIAGLLRVRELHLIRLLKSSNNGDIYKLLEKFIPNKEIYNDIILEINNIQNKKPVSDTIVLGLTFVIYNYLIDQFIKKFIEDEDIINLFITNPDFNKFKNKFYVKLINVSKKYPIVFKNLEEQIINNFFWISNFHRSYQDGADIKRLDKGMDKFIKAINFPGDLEE